MKNIGKSFSKKIEWKKFSVKFLLFFEKGVKLSFFLLLGIFFLWSFFVWYFFVYNFEWSEAEKQEYILSKEKGVVFEKESFEKLIEEKKKREDETNKPAENLNDIFRLNISQ